MRIRIREGNALIETREFESRRITIGSDGGCDITLPDRRVEPIQVTLIPDAAGAWRIETEAGDHLTLLNNRPVGGSAPVKPSDEITIYEYTLVLYESSGEKIAEAAVPTTMLSQEASRLRATPLPSGALIRHHGDDLTLTADHCTRLVQLSGESHQCRDIPKLLDLALASLLSAFAGRVAYVGARRHNYGALEFVSGRTAGGKTTAEPPSFENFAYRCAECNQRICIPESPEPAIGSLMAVPLSCSRGALGILYVDRSKDSQPFESADLDALTMSAAMIAGQIERIILYQIETEQEVRDGRLEFVREIQTRMDPATVPQWEGFQLAVYCKQGQSRGGDIYDVMGLPNGLAAFLLANLSGEPTRTALAMAEVRAAFRVAGLHADPPHVFLRSMNWMLCTDRVPCQMHAAMIVMNPKTGTFEYSTCGGIGALVVDSGGESRELGRGKVSHATPLNDVPPAGRISGFAYGPNTDRLVGGETLALFSSGCWAVCDSSGQPLGEERLVESIRDGFGQSAAVALDDLIQDHAAYFRDGRQPDDVTMLLFHRVAATP
ncbi:MAG: SpoIIE family protein phosphatase [Phycisphaerae bacterium]